MTESMINMVLLIEWVTSRFTSDNCHCSEHLFTKRTDSKPRDSGLDISSRSKV